MKKSDLTVCSSRAAQHFCSPGSQSLGRTRPEQSPSSLLRSCPREPGGNPTTLLSHLAPLLLCGSCSLLGDARASRVLNSTTADRFEHSGLSGKQSQCQGWVLRETKLSFQKITNAFQCLLQSFPEITFSGVPISVSYLEMKGGALEHNLVIINWATHEL